MKILLLALLCLCLGSVSNTRAASVWQVEKNGHIIYLGGTVHLLSEADYPLPDAFSKAYQQSDKLIFETDIAALSSIKTQMTIMQQMTYSDGRTLQDSLQPATLQNLEQHLSERGLTLTLFQSFKPSFVGISITALELQRLGINQKGVDSHFKELAQRDNKPIAWLESIDEQLGFLLTIADGQEDEFINYSMASAADTKNFWDNMISNWRKGDLKALTEEILLPLEQQFPQINRILISQRNANWMPKLEVLFDDIEREFVLVGTLHLAGESGLLTQLKKSGYVVTPL